LSACSSGTHHMRLQRGLSFNLLWRCGRSGQERCLFII
jgi:hypothetical protein